MTRKSIPTGIPQLDALGRVTAKSLKEGHIQKTRDPQSYIFWEDGQYHVTGIPAVIALGDWVNNRRDVEQFSVTVHLRSLRDAQRLLVGHTHLYHYRTLSSIRSAEAIPAR